MAEPSDPGGEMVYMLGPDWQADITQLVLEQLKVCKPTAWGNTHLLYGIWKKRISRSKARGGQLMGKRRKRK